MSENLDFLTSIGESFAEVLSPLAGEDGVCGQDIYEVLSEFSGQPVTPDVLRSLRASGSQSPLAAALNDYFEVSAVMPAHVDRAIAMALKRWGG